MRNAEWGMRNCTAGKRGNGDTGTRREGEQAEVQGPRSNVQSPRSKVRSAKSKVGGGRGEKGSG